MFAYIAYQNQHALLVSESQKPWYNEGIAFVKHFLILNFLRRIGGSV